MPQKGFSALSIILGIFLIIGTAGSAYYLGKTTSTKSQPTNPVITSQTSQTTPIPSPIDETTGWKTYIDTKNSFSLKYPPTWQLQTKEESVNLYPPDVDLTKLLGNFTLGVIGNLPTINVAVLSKSLSEFPKGNKTTQGISFVTDWKTVTISGVNGVYYQAHQCAPQCTANTVLPLNGQKTIRISISTLAQNKGYMPIYEQILSTFKFIN